MRKEERWGKTLGVFHPSLPQLSGGRGDLWGSVDIVGVPGIFQVSPQSAAARRGGEERWGWIGILGVAGIFHLGLPQLWGEGKNGEGGYPCGL